MVRLPAKIQHHGPTVSYRNTNIDQDQRWKNQERFKNEVGEGFGKCESSPKEEYRNFKNREKRYQSVILRNGRKAKNNDNMRGNKFEINSDILQKQQLSTLPSDNKFSEEPRKPRLSSSLNFSNYSSSLDMEEREIYLARNKRIPGEHGSRRSNLSTLTNISYRLNSKYISKRSEGSDPADFSDYSSNPDRSINSNKYDGTDRSRREKRDPDIITLGNRGGRRSQEGLVSQSILRHTLNRNRSK